MVTVLMEDRQCRATSKRSGNRCRRYAIVGGTVCVIHGGGTPRVREAAARRHAEAQATAVLELVWDPDAAPVTDPVAALQALAGKLQHAADVLGARLVGVEFDDPVALAWLRVLRELRQGLEGMERLGLANRQVELEEAQAAQVVSAMRIALEAVSLDPVQQDTLVRTFLGALGRGETPGGAGVVAGEVEP